jgi:hypothetical protein
MPRNLRPPSNLKECEYFVLRYDRDTEEYELLVPGCQDSYVLGDAFAARRYFWALDMEYLGGRAMDSALAFGASQAIPSEARAFGLDITKVCIDPVVFEEAKEDELRRALGAREVDEVHLWQAV